MPCLRQGGVAADAGPKISSPTAEMLDAEAMDSDVHFAGLDDDEDGLDANELVAYNVDRTQIAKSYAVIVSMLQ